MRKGHSDPLSAELAAELAALEAMPDSTIDTTDIAEVQDWSDAMRGRFYKPRKVQKTLRIDADVLAWFEAQGPGHLSRMNQALRLVMRAEITRQNKQGEPT
jgi:uncharacterized protein (DUF4415 family)